jgi:hypothetical protein
MNCLDKRSSIDMLKNVEACSSKEVLEERASKNKHGRAL